MGFYGNITNVNKSTFQFDKIYPNRAAAKDNAQIDGVFVGRYILVDYDTPVNFDQLIEHLNNIDESVDWITELKNETGTSAKIIPGYKVTQVAVSEDNPETPVETDLYPFEFHSGLSTETPIYIPKKDLNDPNYVITGYEVLDGEFVVIQGKIVKEVIDVDGSIEERIINVPFTKSEYELYVVHNGSFVKATADLSAALINNTYLTNFGIDRNTFNQIGRGWDSTVWQKIFNAATGNVEYVMVAELNSVVPTFDITVDAPTVTPIPPHWDSDTSNVYYKLHLQPSWGMRVRHATGNFSNNIIQYPSNVKDTFYWNNDIKVVNQDLAIYWNEEGFDKYKGQYSKDINTNKILVEPTGTSLNTSYNSPDTYELSIMLPEIGNIMSDIWDLIYGKRTEYDLDGNALLIPKEPVEIADSENLLRNTNFQWNTRNGQRMTKKVVINDESVDVVPGYDKNALNNFAGIINSVHDLMGMIIVESDNLLSQSIKKANLDPSNIYYDKQTNKYYIKERQYDFVTENNAKILKANMITKEEMVASGNYYCLDTFDYDNYDDIYNERENPNEPEHISTSNYYKVTNDTVLDESEVYGTLAHASVGEISAEQFKIDGTLFEITTTGGNGSQEVGHYIAKTSGRPGGATYYTLELGDPIAPKTYYRPKKYYLGIKHFDNGSTITKADWLLKDTIDEDDFDNLSLRSDETLLEALASARVNDPNDTSVGYKWLKDVKIDPTASTYAYVDKNRAEEEVDEIVGQQDSHIFLNDENQLEYRAFNQAAILQNPQPKMGERIVEVNGEEVTETIVVGYKYYISKFSDRNWADRMSYVDDGETVIPEGNLKTLKEWVTFWANPELTPQQKQIELDLVLEENLERIIAIPVYTLQDASIVTLIDMPSNGRTGYYVTDNLDYIEVTKLDIDANNGAGNNVMLQDWYQPIPTRAPVYYDVSGGYYLEDESGNLVRETATKLRQDDEHAPNGDYQEVSNWRTLTDENKVLFIPNTYYYKDNNGDFHLAASINDADEFYRYPGQYVVSDTNNIFARGAYWNPEVDPTGTGATLSYKKLIWGVRELPNFAGKLESLHGLMLKIHHLLLAEDEETRDRATVQGAINTLNDIIDKFNQLVPAEIAMVDLYGRVHSGDWDSKQKFGYTNIGKPNASQAIPTGEPVTADDERWVKLTTTSGVAPDFKPHIKLEHTFNPITPTTTQSNLNADDVYVHSDSENVDEGLNNTTNGVIKDTIDLYTPIVDNTGHVVGKNTETVTLPYGFKTITTNGRNSNNNTTALAAQSDIVAENTQDTLGINSGNEWIKIETNPSTDIITVSHDAKVTTTSTSTQNLSTETSGTTTFEIPSYSFDATNHFTNVDTKTVTIPNSYGKFTGDTGNSEASATHDTFSITGDTWVTTTVSSDAIALAHSAAHDAVTITMPQPIAANGVEPAFGSTFTLPDWTFDEKGHQKGVTTHTVKIPKGSLAVNEGVDSSANANVLTTIGFTDTTGAIVATNKLVGTLPLTNYSTQSSIDGMPTATDSINTAISKLAYILNNDTKQVNTRISEAIDALDSSYVALGTNAGGTITSASTTSAVSKISIINGKLDAAGTDNQSVLVDAAGAAAAAKTEVIGIDTDIATANTVYGAKAFATSAANTAEQNAKDYADSLAVNYDTAGDADTAEANAIAAIKTETFTYSPLITNPEYDSSDPTSEEFIRDETNSTTQTIEEWITYIMDRLSQE